MDKFTETIYKVRLVRIWSGSAFTVEVKAVSPAQARRIAANQNPGWQAHQATAS